MDYLKRIEGICFMVDSIRRSAERYQAAEDTMRHPSAGYGLEKCDSRTSIVRRCQVAREELLQVMKYFG